MLADDLALVDARGCGRRATGSRRARARRAGSRGPRPAPRRAAGAGTRSRRRRGRASAARRSAPSGRARSRARRRPSAGCRRRAPPARVAAPPPRTSNSADQRPRALDEPLRERASPTSRPAASRSRAARCSRRSRTRARARAAGGPRGCGRRPASSISRALALRERRGPPTVIAAALRRGAGPRSRRSAPSGRCRRRPRCRRSRRRARANETPRTFSMPRSSTTCRSSTSSSSLARLRRRLLDAQQHLAADHRAGERLLGRALARHRLDLLAAPQDGDPVGDLEHLVQLVADEDDRLAVGLRGCLTIAKSSVASCGVSTAVGSSRIRISAPR